MTQRVALVTGGTGGLGSAMGERLSLDGYTVVANYFPPLEQEALAWQAQMSSGKKCEIDLAPANVSVADECNAMAAALIDKYGRVDVLINNAGITRDATLKKMELEQWQAVIDTNLTSLFNTCKPLLNHMQEKGFGRIVNISSVNAQRGQFGQTNYSAAKAGVHGFTKSLAQETARHGITVNTVSPGFIDTTMVEAIPQHIQDDIIKAVPVGRIGQPEEIARAVRFLVDDDAGYITGTELSVNGGIFMH